MSTEDQAILQRIAATLDEILLELRKGTERHEEIDQTKADAERLRKDPYSNV